MGRGARGWCGTIVVLCAAASADAAGVTAYEGFEYPAGVVGVGEGGWGWLGAWGSDCAAAGGVDLQVVAAVMAPSAYPVAPRGGYARDAEHLGAIRRGHRLLAAPLPLNADAVYYVSFLFRRNGVDQLDTLGVDVTLLSGPDCTFDAVLIAGAVSADTQFRILAPGEAASWGGDLNNGLTYFVVLRIEASASGQDRAYLRVIRPTETVVEPQQLDEWDVWLPIAPHTWYSDAVIDRIGITGNAAYDIDEIRIGTTWAAVTTDPLPAPGEMDGDGDVDLVDYALFAACIAGPELAISPACRYADQDRDGDVDLADLAEFQRNFTGP